jgi:methylated-DNA-protein-cysteine methyltransferase-like protein
VSELRQHAWQRRVWRLVVKIPKGRVATYGQIAVWLGWPRRARMVGLAMRHCPQGVPWQRVVNAQGGISPRAAVGSMLTQRILLEQEGVVLRSGRVPLARYRWQGPKSESRSRRRHGG